MKLAPGMRSLMASRMVCAPSSSVSWRPRSVQQAIGEDVAALGVGGELDLVDGEEIDSTSRGIASTVHTQ